jgi:response regulator RpfG family c-di-GMP phosphodiesterase
MMQKILIVDDEPGGRDALESLLLNQGYQLALASNGIETLSIARTINPDLILLDIMMPGMDGFEVCRQLRADPRIAEVPVIMVTALDDRDSRLQGIEVGADDFVTKPIDRGELRTRVRSILRLNRYRSLQDERVKLEEQINHLTALRCIDIAITTGQDISHTLQMITEQVTGQLHVDAAIALRYDPLRLCFDICACHGFPEHIIPFGSVSIQDSLVDRVLFDQKEIHDPQFFKRILGGDHPYALLGDYFQDYHAIPLVSRGTVLGVLEIFQKAPLDLGLDAQEFLITLSGQAAIAIDSSRTLEDLRRTNTDLVQAYDATIEGWSRAMDLRDKETEGHTIRVTEKTVELARRMGMDGSELLQMRRGALLHDIGKLGVPDAILLKPGPLTDEEWVIMRKHPTYAYELISPIRYLSHALDIPYCHHEKWNGSGYPQGLKGEEIPLAARLFAIIDVWDALSSDRPYRRGWPAEKVFKYLREGSGIHFDPKVVDEFFQLMR